MELIKIILLLYISIACSVSRKIEETEAVAEPELDLKINRPVKNKGNCNGRSCRRNMGHVNNEQRCACFPINSENTPVPQYIINDEQGQLARTVVYVYTIGNKSAIYIPNLEKQSLYTDLTFDDGDILRPLSEQNVNLLQEQNEDHTRRAGLDSENKNLPHQNLENFDLPSLSEDINKEALKHVLEDNLNDLFVPNQLPPSQKDLGLSGAINPHKFGKPQSVFELNPNENYYSNHVDKPQQTFMSQPDNKDVFVQDNLGPQKDFDFNTNKKNTDLHQIAKEPSVFEAGENGLGLNPYENELYSQRVIKPVNIVVPYGDPGSNFENEGLNPNENNAHYPEEGFGFNRDENKLHAKPQDAYELSPINPQAVSGQNPNGNYLHNIQNFDGPSKDFQSEPSKENIHSYENAPRDFGMNSNEDYLTLQQNLNEILVDNIAEPQTIFGPRPNENNLQPIVEPQKSFGLGSLSNTIPKPLKDFGSKPIGEDLYLNSFAQPQRKVDSEKDEGDLTSASLYKPQPNIRCSSGICKLYIYCSRNDCPKYLQSLAKLHTTIHKHPYLENTFVAINDVGTEVNNTDSYLKPFSNLFGLEEVDETLHNIRSIQLGDQIPSINRYGHLLSQQVPRSIPISLNPLSSILDQGATVQNLISPNQIKERRVQYYPRNNKILSSQYRNSPYNGDIYLSRPRNDQYYRRNGALSPKSNGNFLKDLLLLPSQFHQRGMQTVADLVPNFGFRRNSMGNKDASGEIEVPVDEDDIKIKIIGGQPAVSSGTPMQIKARLGDI